MVQLKPTNNGVHVYTDGGTFIGTARANGQPLTSTAALAQLGFTEDEHGTLLALTPEERLAGLGLGSPVAAAVQGGATAPLTPAQKAARTRAARKAGGS